MDIEMIFRGGLRVDMTVENADLAKNRDLETSLIISLFTDRRALPDDELPYGEASRRGFWGDSFPPAENDKIGSRLWLLSRAKQTNETLNLAREYVKEAVQWYLDDGIVTHVDWEVDWIDTLIDPIVINGRYVAKSVMGIRVALEKPDGTVEEYRYRHLWQQIEDQLFGDATDFTEMETPGDELLTEGGDTLVTEDGDPIEIELFTHGLDFSDPDNSMYFPVI